MPVILAKQSATGTITNLTRAFPNNCRYLMKAPSRATWNKRSTLWLSPVSDNLFSSKGIQGEQAEDDANGLTIFSAVSARAVAQAAEASGTPRRGVHEIQVTLRKYEFSPGSLHVRKGERVKLVMAAADHDHGFRLDDFNIDQTISKGTTVVVEFTADKAGTFQFRCSNVCGIGHRSMKGTLVVEE
jgi:cytochrome c oxidase subunit 2